MEGAVRWLIFWYWAVQFCKYVLAPVFLFALAWGTLTLLEREKPAPRSYLTFLGQSVTTEPLRIGAEDCHKLKEVLALSESARKDFKVSCAK